MKLEGQRFGRLVVQAPAGSKDTYRWWQCRCDCGGLAVVRSRSLRTGRTRSCGCLRRESVARARTFRRERSHYIPSPCALADLMRGRLTP